MNTLFTPRTRDTRCMYTEAYASSKHASHALSCTVQAAFKLPSSIPNAEQLTLHTASVRAAPAAPSCTEACEPPRATTPAPLCDPACCSARFHAVAPVQWQLSSLPPAIRSSIARPVMFARAMCDAGARGHAEMESIGSPLLARCVPRVGEVRARGPSSAEVLLAINACCAACAHLVRQPAALWPCCCTSAK